VGSLLSLIEIPDAAQAPASTFTSPDRVMELLAEDFETLEFEALGFEV
jgi:hypothetical protein